MTTTYLKPTISTLSKINLGQYLWIIIGLSKIKVQFFDGGCPRSLSKIPLPPKGCKGGILDNPGSPLTPLSNVSLDLDRVMRGELNR